MMTRGKFLSLTMINWNGFFARTFELDEFVTTLSGGNGAGKSTTMAAFVTALIPDLTLLHFRNTTEAGATSGSRDKGLHGKLKPGVCYAVLDVLNSRQQRILCGVRLQQIAGRDKKVDIKPFILQNVPLSIHPTQLLTHPLENKQVKVRALSELKVFLETQDTIEFKQFNSISDYHAQMFDLGVLSKRLRSSSDRSKFYRLIEASLYGGISSAITRSLREYLLPENGGVRKAFQDMELALKENRMTLNMLRLTQRDRDLFKHLIHESTLYVAADYMRYHNERRQQVLQVWSERREIQQERRELQDKQYAFVSLSKQLAEHKEEQEQLQLAYQHALEHLTQVQSALKQQHKVERYQQDLEELHYRLEEQTMVVEEAQQNITEWQHKEQQIEQELHELRGQLADSQQALDAQQTRKTQYLQAEQALIKARQCCDLPHLSLELLDSELKKRQTEASTLTKTLLEVQQTLNLSQGSQQQFDAVLNVLQELTQQPCEVAEAWQVAKNWLAQWPEQYYLATQVARLTSERATIQQQYQALQDAERLLVELQKIMLEPIVVPELAELQQRMTVQQEELNFTLQEEQQRLQQLQQQQQEAEQQLVHYATQIPRWVIAQETLQQLSERYQQPLESSSAVTQALQDIASQERSSIFERDSIKQQRDILEEKIEQLTQPSGADDARLLPIAEQLGGALLSEIYEDISVEDAAYFSALYGPVRHAIVVPDLAKVRPILEGLSDTPEDLYFIEGDPQSFDDSLFNSEELSGAVLIRSNDRQWRYSRLPEVPLFGRAAREKYLDELVAQRNVLAEQYATLSFDVQKLQRLHEQFNAFIGDHLAIAFDTDPEALHRQISGQLNELQRHLQKSLGQLPSHQQQLEQTKKVTLLINRLLPLQHLLLQQESLSLNYSQISEKLALAQQAEQLVQRNQTKVQQLEKNIDILRSPPAELAQLTEQYTHLTEQQQRLTQELFALSDVAARRAHFAYHYTINEQEESQPLQDQLREQLDEVEQQRYTLKSRLTQLQQQYREISEVQISLKSAYQTKHEVYQELLHEQMAFETTLDENLEQQALVNKEQLAEHLNQNRQTCLQQEKRVSLLEHEIAALQKQTKRGDRDYLQLRQQTVLNKVNWCRVTALVKGQALEKRLYRRDLAYLQKEELRSISDKALGALRLAVADNEHLRDALRYSEDARFPEKKIEFYIAIYQHLKERIRQDIMKTDDPIEAIEQMEIELARLEEELSGREKTLAISAKSVANIIRKIIQREQGRIRLLNQGLQTVAFGQVNGVRINVMIRETHNILLNTLAEAQEQHADLFNNNQITFSEALAKLYQRINPQIEFGQRNPQTIGEELLDYRNYMELDVEVLRGHDGWLRAESGALSTGEAIGTGMSILVMVIQSWEEESKRLRAKDIFPCRLLFLDEAARLDAKSIATLFELCDRLAMQLIIAAPENISPEKGTTYKLVRKLFNNQEHVHVVGLKGFGASPHLAEVGA